MKINKHLTDNESISIFKKVKNETIPFSHTDLNKLKNRLDSFEDLKDSKKPMDMINFIASSVKYTKIWSKDYIEEQLPLNFRIEECLKYN